MSTGGLTQTVVGTGTQNGLNYIDLRFSGTAIGTVVYIRPETVTNIAAATGQTWTNSVYLRAISSAPNALKLMSEERTSAGVYVTEGNSSDFSITSSLAQYTFTRTLNGGATVGAVNPIIRLNLTIGATYNFTIRIAAPQMELGATASTFIPTTTAAVTRLADAASKTGVSSLIGQTEGTLFVDAYFSVTAAGRFFAINDGTIANRILFLRNANNSVTILVTTSTVVQAVITTGILANGSHRFGVSYANNAFNLYVDGALIGTNPSGTVPACSAINVGNELGANIFGDSISQAALFKTRLTNAQLAEITTL
jgi:hypothetical protein